MQKSDLLNPLYTEPSLNKKLNLEKKRGKLIRCAYNGFHCYQHIAKISRKRRTVRTIWREMKHLSEDF